MESEWREVRMKGVAESRFERQPVRHSYIPSHRFNPKPKTTDNRENDNNCRNQKGYQNRGIDPRKPNQERVVTFFFNNIPEDCSMDFLKRKFGSILQVREVYCPRKRDLKGRPFGFVRFDWVEDQKKLLANLNELWIRTYKIRVYKPRFDKEITVQQKKVVEEENEHGRSKRHIGFLPGRIRDEGTYFLEALVGKSYPHTKTPACVGRNNGRAISID